MKDAPRSGAVQLTHRHRQAGARAPWRAIFPTLRRLVDAGAGARAPTFSHRALDAKMRRRAARSVSPTAIARLERAPPGVQYFQRSSFVDYAGEGARAPTFSHRALDERCAAERRGPTHPSPSPGWSARPGAQYFQRSVV